MNRAELLACPECDLLQSDSAFPRPRKALCARCGAILYQRHDNGLERTAALTVAAAVLVAVANAFPIVSLELQGDRTAATLVGAIGALWSQNMQLVAALVAFTALAMPLLEIAALGWLLFPLRYGSKAPYFGDVYSAAAVRAALGHGGGVRARRDRLLREARPPSPKCRRASPCGRSPR